LRVLLVFAAGQEIFDDGFLYLIDQLTHFVCISKFIGTNRYDMEASVTSPSGATERCEIQDLGTSHYSIKFVPKEMGIHTVSVKHRGMHIPGEL
jgi:hypothetical protein